MEQTTQQPPDGQTLPTAEEQQLLAALRRGEESAFVKLVERYQMTLLRLAQLYVPSRAVAEEVVQDTWLGVLRGLDNFEGRSSLKTWIFRILTNSAKTRGQREARSIPFSSLGSADSEDDSPAVDPERFRADGHWSSRPQRWDDAPEDLLLRQEARSRVDAAVATLPPSQREVISLRDIEGWSSEEVCNALAISESNQRVLLHRARSKVRRALEDYVVEARA